MPARPSNVFTLGLAAALAVLVGCGEENRQRLNCPACTCSR